MALEMILINVFFQAIFRRKQFVAKLTVMMSSALDVVLLQPQPSSKVLVALATDVMPVRVFLVLPESMVMREISFAAVAVSHKRRERIWILYIETLVTEETQYLRGMSR